jgi:hypothetical protein
MQARSTKWLLLFIMGVIFSFSSLINAQNGPGPRFDVNTRVKYLKEKLSLNDKQAAEIKKILDAQQDQANKDREQLKGNRDERRKNMMVRAQETDKKINSVLNDKQKEEYKKIVQEREQRWEQRPH